MACWCAFGVLLIAGFVFCCVCVGSRLLWFGFCFGCVVILLLWFDFGFDFWAVFEADFGFGECVGCLVCFCFGLVVEGFRSFSSLSFSWDS